MQDINSVIKEITREEVETTIPFGEYDKRITSGPITVYVKNGEFVVSEYHDLNLEYFKGPLWENVVSKIEKKYGVSCVLSSEGYLPGTLNRPIKYTLVFAKLIYDNISAGIQDVFNAGNSTKHAVDSLTDIVTKGLIIHR